MLSSLSTKCNTINQKNYDDYIKDFPFNKCKCKCGVTGNFHKHAYYKRTLKYIHNKKKITLIILRVQCQSCECTHAIMHPLIIPYSQTPFDTTLTILEAFEEEKNIHQIIDDYPDIDDYDIIGIVKNFKRKWKERLISIGQTINNICIKSIVKIFKVTFMQIKSTYYFGI